MNSGTIFGCVIITFALILLGILNIITITEKQKIRKQILPGFKFIFYGLNGGGNPFKDTKYILTIIDVHNGYVLYKFETKVPRCRPSIPELVDERSCSIKEFVNRTYKTEDVTILNN
jgi:hypothetical protein